MGPRFTVVLAVLALCALALGCESASSTAPATQSPYTGSIATFPGQGYGAATQPSIAQPTPRAVGAVQPVPGNAAVVPARPAAAAAPDFTFRFSVGDEVGVSIWREKDLDVTQRVLRDGTITPPLLDPVRVEGLTIREVRGQLLTRYREYLKDPRISVRVVNVHSNRIYVLGEVRQPQAVLAAGRMSLIQAISQAGGLNVDVADRERIRVVRPVRGQKPRVFTVNMNNVIAGRAADLQVVPGDIVFVQPTGLTNWSRNLTQVLTPISAFFGAAGDIATTIIAIESLND